MRSAYRVLAIIVAVEVFIQAAAIAFASFGLFKWVTDGGVLDKSVLESEAAPDFTGAIGFMIHAVNGQMLIPLIAIALLVVSFFAKVPGGVGAAAGILVMIVVQVMLGIFGHDLPYLGILHGLLALGILGAALDAARRAKTTAPAEQSREAARA